MNSVLSLRKNNPDHMVIDGRPSLLFCDQLMSRPGTIDSFIFFVHDEAVKTAGHTGTSGSLMDESTNKTGILGDRNAGYADRKSGGGL